MAMIRGTDAGPMVAKGAAMDLGDLARRAEVMREAAIAEAERIVARAHEQANREAAEILARAAEEGRAEGHERGLAEGREQGHREAFEALREELGRIAAAWESALASFEARREAMFTEAKRDVLDLAVEIARRVTKRTARSDPGVAVEQLREALSLIARPTRLRVAANPDDLAVLHEALPLLLERFGEAHHAELRPDPALERGSCVVETDRGGQIDASIDAQLDRIVGALTSPGLSDAHERERAA